MASWKKWTNETEEYLKNNYENLSVDELRINLFRLFNFEVSCSAVRAKANILDIRKSDGTLKKIKRDISKKRDTFEKNVEMSQHFTREYYKDSIKPFRKIQKAG